MAAWMLFLRPKTDAGAPAASTPAPAATTSRRGRREKATSLAGKAVEKANEATAAQDARAEELAGGAGETAATARGHDSTTAGHRWTPEPAKGTQPGVDSKNDAKAPACRCASSRRSATSKVVVLLFWTPKAVEDRAVRKALNGIDRHHGKVLAHAAHIKRIAGYQQITRGAEVSQSPTVVVIDRNRQVSPSSATSTGRDRPGRHGRAAQLASGAYTRRVDAEAFESIWSTPGGAATRPGVVPRRGRRSGACGDLVRDRRRAGRRPRGRCRFEASGCGAAVAAGSAVVELVRGARGLDAARVGAGRSRPSSAGSRRASCTRPSWPPTRCSRAGRRGEAPGALSRRPPHAGGHERRRRLGGGRAARGARGAAGGGGDARAVARRRQRRRGRPAAPPRRAAGALRRAPAWGSRTSRSTCAPPSRRASCAVPRRPRGRPHPEPVRALQRRRAARRDARSSPTGSARPTSPRATTRASRTTGSCAPRPTRRRTRATCSPRSRPPPWRPLRFPLGGLRKPEVRGSRAGPGCPWPTSASPRTSASSPARASARSSSATAGSRAPRGAIVDRAAAGRPPPRPAPSSPSASAGPGVGGGRAALRARQGRGGQHGHRRARARRSPPPPSPVRDAVLHRPATRSTRSSSPRATARRRAAACRAATRRRRATARPSRLARPTPSRRRASAPPAQVACLLRGDVVVGHGPAGIVEPRRTRGSDIARRSRAYRR